MKKIFFIVFCLITTTHNIFSQNTTPKTTVPTIAPSDTVKKNYAIGKNQFLKQFTFTDINGKPFSNKNLPKFKYLTVVFYDPGCSHCYKQALEIAEQYNKFKKTVMLWISINETQYIKGFKEKYFANKQKIIFVKADTPEQIFVPFNELGTTPSFMIYNKDKKLIAAYDGETPLKTLYQHYK